MTHASQIYEVNPEFRILTFSDESLSCVHISSFAPVGGALRHVKAMTASDAADAQQDREYSLSAAVRVVVNTSEEGSKKGVARTRRSISTFQQVFQGCATGDARPVKLSTRGAHVLDTIPSGGSIDMTEELQDEDVSLQVSQET